MDEGFICCLLLTLFSYSETFPVSRLVRHSRLTEGQIRWEIVGRWLQFDICRSKKGFSCAELRVCETPIWHLQIQKRLFLHKIEGLWNEVVGFKGSLFRHQAWLMCGSNWGHLQLIYNILEPKRPNINQILGWEIYQSCNSNLTVIWILYRIQSQHYVYAYALCVCVLSIFNLAMQHNYKSRIVWVHF